MSELTMPQAGPRLLARFRRSARATQRPLKVERPLRLVLTLLVAVAAGLLAFALFAHETYDVGPGRVYVAARPALQGSTTLSLPPFGTVTAATHRAPVAVTASLQEVDLGQLQAIAVNGMPSERSLGALKAEIERGAMRAVGKGLIAALLTATFVGWSLRRSPRSTLAAGLLGVVVPALLLAATVRGFDPQAFRTPTYRGAMKYAPALIGLVQNRVNFVGGLQAQLGQTVKELSAYYEKPQTFSAGGAMPNTVRVLAVSDLHEDPIGFRLESQLADEFGVAAILDVGDLTNFGTPIEASLIQRYLDTRYPRIVVPGNHESPAVVRTLEAMPNVTVLKDATATVEGIGVYGLADPMSEKDGWEPDKPAVLARSKAAAEKLRSAEASGQTVPDIVAVHDPKGAEEFAGLAPLLVSGHTHTADLGRFGSSWYANGGTVGGVHFSKLSPDPHIPHGATILYYTKDLPRRLVAIDQISVYGRSDQTSLKRTIVDPKLLEQTKVAAKAGAPTAEKAGAAKKP